MSTLLNQKEDVLKIEFTKHGRKVLGDGFFKPYFVSFHDDSVIYDSLYGTNILEPQNNIHDRIMENSITFPCLNLLSEKLENPLGDSDPLTDYAPAWSIVALQNKLEYKQAESNYSIKRFSFDNIQARLFFKDDVVSKESILIENDYILIDLQELNMSDDFNNFEVELVYTDNLTNKEENLLFLNKKTNIINDLLYEDSELPNRFAQEKINDKNASYYFDILVDEEIDTEYIAYPGIKETANQFSRGISNMIDDIGGGGGVGGGGGGGRDETEITLTPSGEIVRLEAERIPKTIYSGPVCTLLCCP